MLNLERSDTDGWTRRQFSRRVIFDILHYICDWGIRNDWLDEMRDESYTYNIYIDTQREISVAFTSSFAWLWKLTSNYHQNLCATFLFLASKFVSKMLHFGWVFFSLYLTSQCIIDCVLYVLCAVLSLFRSIRGMYRDIRLYIFLVVGKL